jgi:predicted RNA binding protein with dsRBD fold (UPF0201 family)
MTTDNNVSTSEKQAKLKQDILNMVNEKDNVSFVDLEEIQGFKGNYEYSLYPVSEVVLWYGVSLDAIQSLKELMLEEKIDLASTSVLTYLVDGKALKLPLAKSPATIKYKKPHWFPVMFNKVKIKGSK